MFSMLLRMKEKISTTKLSIPKPPKQIAKPANHDQILEEMACLKKGDYRLLQSKKLSKFTS